MAYLFGYVHKYLYSSLKNLNSEWILIIHTF